MKGTAYFNSVQCFIIIIIIIIIITIIIWNKNRIEKPVPVAERSKARVYGRSLAGIAGSNPVGGHGWLSVVNVVCCQVEVCATS